MQYTDMSSDSDIILTPSDTVSAEWSDVELIHQHGLQSLYRVRQYGRWYMLKAAPLSDKNVVERLRKEFALGVGLEHPNIVRTLDYGYDERVGEYIRMEWIDGVTLSEWLSTHPSHDLRQRIVSQLLDAVAYLHAHQMVHRDLKPGNIMVTLNGNNLKLIDFGLSDSDDYTVFKQPAGTLSYIAPEQLSGAKADVRADIYSLGKILAIIFPVSYRRIRRTCTQSDVAQRYPTVQELTKAFERANRCHQQWPWYICPVLLVLTWIGVGIGLLQPDPRGQVIAQAHELVAQEYAYLIRLPEPTTASEWSANTVNFYTRCGDVRDSVAQTINNEALRTDFVNAMILEAGRKAQEYQTSFNQSHRQKD